MTSPLDNLQQNIYDQRRGDVTPYFLVSRAPPSRSMWEVALWTPEGPGDTNPRVWAGLGDAGDETRAEELANAIGGGMLSVQARDNGGIKLLIHLSKGPVSVYLDPADSGSNMNDLLTAAMSMKAAPATGSDDSSTRMLKARIAELEKDNTSLVSRIANLTATIQRETGSSGRKDVQPTVKAPAPPPANASVLQPNQRRRKVEEDEFMGSSDEEEESEEEYDEDD